eukprot:1652056-Prymnesium_polylepis.1
MRPGAVSGATRALRCLWHEVAGLWPMMRPGAVSGATCALRCPPPAPATITLTIYRPATSS